jgi:ABC-type transport system involved in cytochrome c biogenesis permease subunit
MELKFTIQGLLIYTTMAAYLLAMLANLLRRQKTADMLFICGFAIAAVSYFYRWYTVRHVPMQNLFEVFLCLGVSIYPISIFCRRVLRVGGMVADALIGIVVLFPAGFVFDAQPQRLPPALQSWLFAPHVAVYILSYVFLAKAAHQAVLQLARRMPTPQNNMLPPEQATYRMVCTAFPLLTLGLVLGSIWGKVAWGDYWGWDPKELWSLASWLVYVGYLHFRYMFAQKHPRINSVWVLAGMTVIIITLLWVNLSQLFPGLHSYAF